MIVQEPPRYIERQRSVRLEGVVEDVAVIQGHLVQDVRPLVLDSRFSWLATNPVGSAKEHRLLWLYVVTAPFFFILTAYAFVKYWVWRMITKPKGMDKLALKLQLAFFGGVHHLLKVAHQGVTSWTALAVLYSAPLVAKFEHGWRGLGFRFWMFHPECQAVRNRLLEVRDRIYRECVRLAETQIEIRIASWACGASAAVMDAVHRFQEVHPEIRVSVALVDIDRNSTDLAYALAKELEIEASVYTMKIGQFATMWALMHSRFDIVEETGFLDYRPDDAFVENCASVRKVLKPGGLFLGGQIDARWHSPHRSWLIGWMMLIPRSRKKFTSLLRQAFPKEEIDLYTEPWKTYHVASVRL